MDCEQSSYTETKESGISMRTSAGSSMGSSLWRNMMTDLPGDNVGKCLVAKTIDTNPKMSSVRIAWWEPRIGTIYPFKHYSQYEDRQGGGWVVADAEEDYELRGVEWWMEIPPVP